MWIYKTKNQTFAPFLTTSFSLFLPIVHCYFKFRRVYFALRAVGFSEEQSLESNCFHFFAISRKKSYHFLTFRLLKSRSILYHARIYMRRLKITIYYEVFSIKTKKINFTATPSSGRIVHIYGFSCEKEAYAEKILVKTF